MVDDRFQAYWRTVKFYRQKTADEQRNMLATFIVAKAKACTDPQVKICWLQFFESENERHWLGGSGHPGLF